MVLATVKTRPALKVAWYYLNGRGKKSTSFHPHLVEHEKGVSYTISTRFCSFTGHSRTPTMHDDMTIISAGNGPMGSQERDMDQWEDRDWEMDQSESCTPHLSWCAAGVQASQPPDRCSWGGSAEPPQLFTRCCSTW